MFRHNRVGDGKTMEEEGRKMEAFSGEPNFLETIFTIFSIFGGKSHSPGKSFPRSHFLSLLALISRSISLPFSSSLSLNLCTNRW